VILEYTAFPVRAQVFYYQMKKTKPKAFYNNIYLLQLDCHPVAVVILHVYKI